LEALVRAAVAVAVMPRRAGTRAEPPSAGVADGAALLRAEELRATGIVGRWREVPLEERRTIVLVVRDFDRVARCFGRFVERRLDLGDRRWVIVGAHRGRVRAGRAGNRSDSEDAR